MRHAVPHPRLGAGRRDEPAAVRGLRLPRRPARTSPTPSRRGSDQRAQQRCRGLPCEGKGAYRVRRRQRRARRYRPERRTAASRRGSTATATRTSPTARSSPARCDSVNGQINFSFPAVHHGREVEDVRLTFKGGKVVDAHGDQGRGLPHHHARHGRRQPHPGRDRHRHQLRHHRSTRATPSSTKRSAAPSTSPSAWATPRPATPTPAACTGTWSATSATAASPGGTITADGEVFHRDGRFLDPAFPQPV